ncbi:MAG: serine hydrolase [Anaerolineales bacterium]|nr:serine hydrolase [Anaerolineales bacterium]
MLNNILPRTSPEAQGIASSVITDFVASAETTIENLHSFMLLRHGAVVAEAWWHPYRAEAPHMLYSLSKSFTSTAVGMAVAEGRLSVNDLLLKFFPEDAPKKISKNLAAMKVRHLLSMSTGHDQDTTERTMYSRNPFKTFLSLPVEHDPGTHFVYNSGATYMLAAIVQKLSGQTLMEYLTPRLFKPLGIENAAWESHPNGVNFGGWGLNIKTEDIARFGQLYLQKGQWNGQQLFPAAWVEEATSKQVQNGPDPNPDWEQGYGFQFWRCQPRGVYRGDGAFGQFCIVMPEQDAVLAITAGVPDMQSVLSLVWDKLLPAMRPAAQPEDTAAASTLSKALKGLAISPPHGTASSALGAQLSGKTFAFQPNELRLHSLSFDFAANRFTYRLLSGGQRRGKHSLKFGNGGWVEDVTSLSMPTPSKVAASGVWTAENTFVLSLCHYETPYIHTFTCTFAEDQVTFHFKANVSFGPLELPVMAGKLVENPR